MHARCSSTAVIHNWSDDQVIAILKNCRAAMAEGGKVVMIEVVVSPEACRVSARSSAYRFSSSPARASVRWTNSAGFTDKLVSG